LVEWAFVLARILINAVLIHHRIIHYDRETVDKALFRDGPRFAEAGGVFLALFGLSDGIFFCSAAHKERRDTDPSHHRQECCPILYVHKLLPSLLNTQVGSNHSTALTCGIFQVPSRIDGDFSLGQYSRIIKMNLSLGEGNQFDSLSAPGLSFWTYRSTEP